MAWAPHESWWVPLDIRDIHQERALAKLEGRDEEEAAKAWIRAERRWYRTHLSFPDGEDGDALDLWVVKFMVAIESRIKPQRTPESIEQRRAYVREWWRKNGKEYRQRRKKAE